MKETIYSSNYFVTCLIRISSRLNFLSLFNTWKFVIKTLWVSFFPIEFQLITFKYLLMLVPHVTIWTTLSSTLSILVVYHRFLPFITTSLYSRFGWKCEIVIFIIFTFVKFRKYESNVIIPEVDGGVHINELKICLLGVKIRSNGF